jgi:hypothetical protein
MGRSAVSVCFVTCNREPDHRFFEQKAIQRNRERTPTAKNKKAHKDSRKKQNIGKSLGQAGKGSKTWRSRVLSVQGGGGLEVHAKRPRL